MIQILRAFYIKIFNFFLPSSCLVCDNLLLTDERKIDNSGVCFECTAKLSFITKPVCIKCCEKFSTELLHNEICLDCLANNWDFDHMVACVRYNQYASKVAVMLKYKQLGVTYIAKLIVQNLNIIDEKIDCIIPVPLHWKRLFWRGFNQSALLGKEIANMTNLYYDDSVLLRKKHTISQGKLTQNQRMQNVSNAFNVEKKYIVKDKVILLIDDVVTTSSTVQACAKVLKKAGAKKIIVAAWAKRVLNDHVDTNLDFSQDEIV